MGDGDRREAPPLHFGDYPHGAYWSADRRLANSDVSGGPPPWVTSEPRSAVNPYPIRMFAEIGCDFALWGPVDEPPPTSSGAHDADTTLEEKLPISASLRDRLLAWGRDYETDGLDGEEFDHRGYHLSRELKRELGDLYSVAYSLTFAGPHREVIRRRAETEPLPGWRLKD
jgi:hypothetical protein